MASEDGTPVRTCLVCGKKASKRELIRLVLQGGKPVADNKKRMPGRGAYVCRRKECMENLAYLKAGGRPFRKPVAADEWQTLSAALLGRTGKKQ